MPRNLSPSSVTSDVFPLLRVPRSIGELRLISPIRPWPLWSGSPTCVVTRESGVVKLLNSSCGVIFDAVS